MAQSWKAENLEKRRWWKEHIDTWSASGKTQTAYCRGKRFKLLPVPVPEEKADSFFQACIYRTLSGYGRATSLTCTLLKS
jgi:hypothetical protein